MTILFDFQKKYVLENDRAKLIPLEYSHFPHLLPFSLYEPDIWKFSLLQAGGEDNLKKYIDLALLTREKEIEYPFIVFDKLKNEYAGSTRFYDIQLKQSTLQLGYTWYGKDFQGTGLNRNCKYLLLEFAFEEMGMERVEFRADYDNKRSIAAMKGIGCTVEGILRNHGYKPDGSRRDSIVLSILKNEWLKKVKEKLKNKIAQ